AVRDDLDRCLDGTSVLGDADARPDDPHVSFDGLGHGGAQARDQALAGDREQVEIRFAVRVFEERAGTSAELEHFHALVDDYARGTVIGKQNSVGVFLQIAQTRVGPGWWRWLLPRGGQTRTGRTAAQPDCWTEVGGLLGVDPGILVQERKQIGKVA